MQSPAILVVDDDVDTCRNLSDILADVGYQVDTAHNGPSALELVRQKRYDVALLDLKMPGMDGLMLYREIKRLSAGTVGVIITAYAGGTTADEAGAVGVVQVWPKPIDVGKLLRLVDQAIDQPLVLIVDDDPDLCANLWDLLRDRHFRVCLAHGEKEAQTQLTGASFEVVLIDMRLPEGDGSSVFRRVRLTNPETRTILITGFRSETEELVQQVLAEGADAACYKPFDVPALLTTLERLSQAKSESSNSGS
jgi:CheY-like chemotaxis protein